MNKLHRATLALMVFVVLSAPSWAHGSVVTKQHNYFKSAWHHWCRIIKERWHEEKVETQYRVLVKKYENTMEEAQQRFLEYLGTAPASSGEDIEALKAKYQQQIDELNAQITDLQQQLEASAAAHAQELADQQNASEQALAALTASYDAAMAELQTCTLQKETAFEQGRTAGLGECIPCGPPGEPQLESAITTGQFYPYAVDAGSSGNFYILDDYNASVAEFTADGSQVAQFSSANFQQPVDIAVDSQGAVYVLDQQAPDSLQKYGMNGQQVALNADADNITGQPGGLFIDSQDRVYVTDMGGTNGGRILVFDSSGNRIDTLGDVPELPFEPYLDVAVDEQNSFVYVVTNSKVAKLDMAGGFITSWQGSFSALSSVAVGSQGQVFVIDSFNSEVYQFDADGNLMYTIGSQELQVPYRIAVDDAGKLYVADYFNAQVKIYK